MVAVYARSSALFAFELTCILFVPLLVSQVLWIWAIRSIDIDLELESDDPDAETDFESSAAAGVSNWSLGDSISAKLDSSIKILCIIDVPLWNKTDKPRLNHISETWGSECDAVHYFKRVHNATDRLGRLRQFYNARRALLAAYPWTVHAHPGTYLIMGNLRQEIARRGYPADVPIVMGHNSKALVLSNGVVQYMLHEPPGRPGGDRRPLFEHLFGGTQLNEESLRPYNVHHAPTRDDEGRLLHLTELGKTEEGSIFNFKMQLRLEKDINYGSRNAITFPNLLPGSVVALHYLLTRLHIGPANSNWTTPLPKQGNSTSGETRTAPISSTAPESPPLRAKNKSRWYEMTEEELDSVYLAREVKILCMILTGPGNHMKRAIHVRRTWGRRCNYLVFLSSQADEFVHTVALRNVQEGREYLWQKLQQGYRYVYEHFKDKVDWFYKVDDDAYVVMENLRSFLAPLDPKEPMYLGLRLNGTYTHPWVTGGPGYTISNAALKMLVEQGLSKRANETRCPVDIIEEWEDVFTSLCLHYLNVPFVDTRDELERARFFQHSVVEVVNGQMPKFFYEEYQYYPIARNISCCSSSAVGFHYIKPFQLYEMEYIVYDLNESGRRYRLGPAAKVEERR